MRSDYDESLLLGYVEGELSDGERRKVESWMQDDPRLEALLRGMTRDRQALRDEPTPDPPDWLLDDVHHGLERSMLLDPKADQAAVVVRQRHVVRKLLAGFAVAAMVLLACGVVLYSVMKINNEPVEWPNTVADATSKPQPEPRREEATDGSRNAVADTAKPPAAPPADESAADLPESLAEAHPQAPRALPPQAREAEGETDTDAAEPPVLADAAARTMEAADAETDIEADMMVDPAPDQAAQAPTVALAPRRTEQPAFGLAQRREQIAGESSTGDADATDALDADLMAFGRRLEVEQSKGAAAGADRTETLEAPPVNFGLVHGEPSGRPMQLRVRTEDLGRSIRRLNEVAGRLDRASLTAATVIYAGESADDEPTPPRLGSDTAKPSMDPTIASPRKAQPLVYRLVLPAGQLPQAIDLLQSPDGGYQRVDIESRPSADSVAEVYRELWPRTEPDYQRILRARLGELDTDDSTRAETLEIPIIVERQARVDPAVPPADADQDRPAMGSSDPSPTGAAPSGDTAAPDSAEPDDDGDNEAAHDAPTPSEPSP